MGLSSWCHDKKLISDFTNVSQFHEILRNICCDSFSLRRKKAFWTNNKLVFFFNSETLMKLGNTYFFFMTHREIIGA